MATFKTNVELEAALCNAETVSFPVFPMRPTTFVEARANGTGTVLHWSEKRHETSSFPYKPILGVTYRNGDVVSSKDVKKQKLVYNHAFMEIEKWSLYEWPFKYTVNETEPTVIYLTNFQPMQGYHKQPASAIFAVDASIVQPQQVKEAILKEYQGPIKLDKNVLPNVATPPSYAIRPLCLIQRPMSFVLPEIPAMKKYTKWYFPIEAESTEVVTKIETPVATPNPVNTRKRKQAK